MQGKFMSDQSVTGLSDRSAAGARPAAAAFGTLTAADAGALGANYQLPGRSPAAGIINFKSNGIFNLPRYYPTSGSYRRFDDKQADDDDVGDAASTWRSGDTKCLSLRLAAKPLQFHQPSISPSSMAYAVYTVFQKTPTFFT